MSIIIMNEDKIGAIIRESGGVCLSCGAVEHNSIEPDAINYMCGECGDRAVVGIETALLSELVVPSKSKHPVLDEYIKGGNSEE